jgi:Helitron helicase-like domain at N-terminus
LLPGQTAADRPDLVSRVFKAKVSYLLDDICKYNALGVAVAHIWTIEFQKRGLPHIYMIIFLKRESKLITPEHVNSLISAEFPDKETQPEIYDLVSKFMVHGPCGGLYHLPPIPVESSGIPWNYGHSKAFHLA